MNSEACTQQFQLPSPLYLSYLPRSLAIGHLTLQQTWNCLMTSFVMTAWYDHNCPQLKTFISSFNTVILHRLKGFSTFLIANTNLDTDFLNPSGNSHLLFICYPVWILPQFNKNYLSSVPCNAIHCFLFMILNLLNYNN